MSAPISVAAVLLGLPDPVPIERELTGVDVDALLAWFQLALEVADALSAGGDRLADAQGLLAAGWSSTAPRILLTRQREAARATGQIIRGQLDAVQLVSATLRQTRQQADGRVAEAESALLRTGWPAPADLMSWAVMTGRLPAVSAAVSSACEDLTALRRRNEAALQDLAGALRADPREPVTNLLPTAPTGGDRASYSAAGATAVGAPVPAATLSALHTVEKANSDRLTADLHSSDVSTVLMALGVTGAIARARDDGSTPHLLLYESANSRSQGRAAISVGDLAAADNVAIMVPGIGNAPADMAGGLSDAAALVRESQRQAPNDSTAVIAWYGYDIPFSSIAGVPVTPPEIIGNAAAATDDANAGVGGAALIADLAGFRRLAPVDARWVAVGFSMGSTTVSAAAAQGGTLDDLVLLGSPGAGQGVSTADDYRAVTPEHTFVTAFDQDPVTRTESDLAASLVGAAIRFPPRASPFGPDPAARSFGAQVVDVPSNQPDIEVNLGILGPLGGLDSALTNEVVDLLAHHQASNYLGGESLQAVASVVVGHYSDVPIKPGR